MTPILLPLIYLVGAIAAVGIVLCLLDKLVMRLVYGAGENQP